MKKIFTLAAAAMLALAANAQIASSHGRMTETTVHSSNTTWYSRVGLSLNNFAGDASEGLKSRAGYDFEVGFQKTFAKVDGLYWGMNFGLGSRGWKYSEDGDLDEKQLSHNFRYSPFTMGYKYEFSNGFALDAHIGAFVSVDYAGKIKIELNGESADLSIGDWDEFYDDDWQRFDAGMQLGFGAWYDRFNLDFTWHRGFIKAVPDYDFYTSNFMIRLGVAF